MREIKFRAWDSETKKFYPWGLSLENGRTFTSPPSRDGWVFEHNQFTGLRDKNGVEIYEGDIVKVNGKYYANHAIGWVIYHEDSAGFGVAFDELSPLGVIRQDLEVIGNIYENQELLK